MEVTHREDFVTHAVIGGGESISMGITDDAMFMHMLSSTLYSDKILAVSRESLCNAWDAHLEAKRVDRPIEVTLERDKLTIRDFGFGIAHSQIGPIYGTYGASTKKNDGTQTGGFGLGCKSPFAYTDHFEVVSCHNGIKTVYRMTKSSAELNGKPGIVPILSVPTEEEGLTMSLHIKDMNDYKRFDTLIRRLVANGEINATLNGEVLPIIEFSKGKNGYVITKETVLENFSRIALRYGNVIYPLESHIEYRHDYERVVKILEMLGNHYGARRLVLQAKPNTLSITPSREALSMEQKTVETVTAMLKKFLHQHHTRFDRECMTLVTQTNESFVAKGKAAQLLRSPTSKNLMLATSSYGKRNVLITDTAEAAGTYLSMTYPEDKQFARKDTLNRLTCMIKAGVFSTGLIQSFRSEFRRQMSGLGAATEKTDVWFQRNIVAPLVVPMQGTAMKPEKLMVFASKKTDNGWGYSAVTHEHNRYYARDMYDLLPFLRKLLVLTHSQNKIEDRVRRVDGFNEKYHSREGFMVYIVPRMPKKIEEAREFFAKQDVVVIDLTLTIEKREPVTRSALKTTKLKGYPTLLSSVVGEKFDQDEAKNGMGKISRVEKPLFFTFLNAKSNKYTSNRDLPDFERATARKICKLWGKQGAVVFNQTTADKLRKEGVPSITVFVHQQMQKLMKDKVVIKYMGVSVERMKRQLETDQQCVIDAVETIHSSPVLYEALKLGLSLPEDKALLVSLWEDVQFNNNMLDVRRTVKDIPLHTKVSNLVDKIKASKTIPLVDFMQLAKRLKNKEPAVVDHAVKFFLKTLKD